MSTHPADKLTLISMAIEIEELQQDISSVQAKAFALVDQAHAAYQVVTCTGFHNNYWHKAFSAHTDQLLALREADPETVVYLGKYHVSAIRCLVALLDKQDKIDNMADWMKVLEPLNDTAKDFDSIERMQLTLHRLESEHAELDREQEQAAFKQEWQEAMQERA